MTSLGHLSPRKLVSSSRCFFGIQSKVEREEATGISKYVLYIRMYVSKATPRATSYCCVHSLFPSRMSERDHKAGWLVAGPAQSSDTHAENLVREREKEKEEDLEL